MENNNGSLVSQLMQEINSGNNEPSFNPNNIDPPLREDDNEEYYEKPIEEQHEFEESEESEESEGSVESYPGLFEHIGGEYASLSIMEMIKSSVIILIGYVIFSHPMVNYYINDIFSSIPVLSSFVNVPTYYLILKGICMVLFYLIVIQLI